MNEMCEKAPSSWRGLLYKRLGKNEQAVKDFRRAFDLNPRNIDAGREDAPLSHAGRPPIEQAAGEQAFDAAATEAGRFGQAWDIRAALQEAVANGLGSLAG